MPHKHKRRQKDANTYDLPPTVIAKPLPVRDPKQKPTKGKPQQKSQTTVTSTNASQSTRKSKSKPNSTNPATGWADDTPRAFRRIMQFQGGAKPQKKRKRNSDDSDDSDSDEMPEPVTTGQKKNKKKSAPAPAPAPTAPNNAEEEKEEEEEEQEIPKPKIMPGEKLSDFAARVDREMPLANMKRSNKPAAADMPKIRETRVTKHEKHLRRLQEQWRKDDKEILEREAAEREEREEEMEEQLRLWGEWEVEAGKRKAKKSGGGAKKKDVVRDDPDPWAKLKRERMNKQISPLDVVQAPPQLTKPREIFKVRGGAKVDVANVPAAVGSLRRREELASERRNIVEEYRRLMAEKRRG